MLQKGVAPSAFLRTEPQTSEATPLLIDLTGVTAPARQTESPGGQDSNPRMCVCNLGGPTLGQVVVCAPRFPKPFTKSPGVWCPVATVLETLRGSPSVNASIEKTCFTSRSHDNHTLFLQTVVTSKQKETNTETLGSSL
jgi:hypothetical protein